MKREQFQIKLEIIFIHILPKSIDCGCGGSNESSQYIVQSSYTCKHVSLFTTVVLHQHHENKSV